MIGIYKITSPSNKIYIGKSINIEHRKKQYRNFYTQSKGQGKIYNSLKKYGWENHTFEIIEECSVEHLNEREIYWIFYYNSMNEGLNIQLGGEGGFHSFETIEKMRKTKLGKSSPWAIPTAKNMGKSNKGKKRDDHFKTNIRLNNSKPIIQFDLNGNIIKEWDCGYDAARFLNKRNSAISECCNGKRKSAYGFIWRFK
jgi:group I intron endonuclease